MFTSLGRKVLKCPAPFSSAFDCTTQTAPNSPVPSAGKGRYYTPQTHNDTQATLISLISRCHPFHFTPGTTLSLHSGLLPACGFSPGGAGHRWEPSADPSEWNEWMTHSHVVQSSSSSSSSQMPNPFYPNSFKVVVFVHLVAEAAENFERRK